MANAAPVNNTVLLIAFGLYTLGIIAVGVYSARFARRSDEDFFLAGRSLGPWVAALSASASSESGWPLSSSSTTPAGSRSESGVAPRSAAPSTP